MTKAVEQALNNVLPSQWQDSSALNAALCVPIQTFLATGGKRLRPVFFLRLTQNFGRSPSEFLGLAALIELIHNGTLVIDDIEDQSDLRRGHPTMHRQFGLDVAVNAGLAMHLLPIEIITQADDRLTDYQRVRLLRIMGEELIKLYQGQAMDIWWHKHSTDPPNTDDYFKMCRFKTGSLMRLSARFACTVTSQPEETEQALAAFAESAGVAFQIKDDILDLTADQDKFGKQVGNDITEGKMSLPVLIALSELSADDRVKLQDILGQHTRDTNLINEGRGLIMQTSAISSAQAQAQAMVTTALDQIKAVVANQDCLTCVQDIADMFLNRDH